MASSLTSKVVDKYMRCQMALYQVRTDPMLPMDWMKLIHDPNYRLKKYQDKVKAQQAKAASEAEGDGEWYLYRPLKEREIRVLRIYPGPAGSPIECGLTTSSLDDETLAFDALSYTWGDPTAVHRIACDGKALQVTESLWTALRQLRHAEVTRTIWIDAVCINQGDVAERSAQVALMSALYRRAATVVVWLGPSTPESVVALNLVRRIRDAAVRTAPDRAFEPIADADELRALGLPAWNAPEWAALDALFWRPWFTRIWVVQEITLAKDSVVMCGSDGLPWADLFWAAHLIRHRRLDGLGGFSASTIYPLIALKRDYESKERTPLLSLVALFRRSLATNPADKIYGLMGMAAAASPGLVAADYSLPYRRVFTDVAVRLLHDSLDVLSHVEDVAWKTDNEVPSWVPDWAAHRYATPFLWPTGPFEDSFRACGDTTPSIWFRGLNDTSLVLKGVVIDRVSVVGTRVPATNRLEGLAFQEDFTRAFGANLMSQLRVKQFRMCELLVLGLKTYPTGEDIRSVLARLMVADAPVGGPEANASTKEIKMDLVAAHAEWRKLHTMFSFEKAQPMREEDRTIALQYAQATAWPSGGRRIFTTKQGYAGWGPWGTGKNDLVVLFEGGKTAYMIREASTQEKDRQTPARYEFLGEAYLHGFMKGEGFSEAYQRTEFELV